MYSCIRTHTCYVIFFIYFQSIHVDFLLFSFEFQIKIIINQEENKIKEEKNRQIQFMLVYFAWLLQSYSFRLGKILIKVEICGYQ